jgi:hypothetical protein
MPRLRSVGLTTGRPTRVLHMAEALAPEGIAARLAEVREQLKLLADYL